MAQCGGRGIKMPLSGDGNIIRRHPKATTGAVCPVSWSAKRNTRWLRKHLVSLSFALNGSRIDDL